MGTRKGITDMFNVSLFIFLLANGLVEYLATPEDNTKVPWDKVYEFSPAAGILGMLLIIIAMALLCSVITRVFWNRFITDVFKVREITFNESLAIVLVLAIIST